MTDDSFLYFRCWLISQGSSIFYETLNDPEKFADYFTPEDCDDLEDLLSVADYAFMEKTGKEIDDDSLPGNPLYSYDASLGSIEDDYKNYGPPNNIILPKTMGEDYDAKDLPKMYPKLFQIFGKIDPLRE